ncbi:MAG: hypothetical protein ACJAWV_002159 [Flammeovirgaceae bacterium]|jgi:hypothetical protein
MKNRLKLTFLLNLLVFSISAQKFSSELWHEGVVDLKEGKTIKGKIKYNLESDVVLLNVENQVLSLNPNQVESFQFSDELTARTRYFFSLPYAFENNYKRNYFFELLLEGKKNLLTREKIVRETRYYYSPYGIGSSPAYTALEQQEDFFLMGNDARIKGFESPKGLIETSLSNHYDKIKSYIKMNHLKIEKRNDMSMIVEYYNGLGSTD